MYWFFWSMIERHTWNPFKWPLFYFIVFTLVCLAILAYGLAFFNDTFHCTVDDGNIGGANYALAVMMLVLGIANFVLALFVSWWTSLQPNLLASDHSGWDAEGQRISILLDSDWVSTMKIIRRKIRWLGFGVFMLAVVNCIMWIVKGVAIKTSNNYECVNDWFYWPSNNIAVMILFIDMILDMAGTFLLWHVLFQIPYFEGSVSRLWTWSVNIADKISLQDDADFDGPSNNMLLRPEDAASPAINTSRSSVDSNRDILEKMAE